MPAAPRLAATASTHLATVWFPLRGRTCCDYRTVCAADSGWFRGLVYSYPHYGLPPRVQHYGSYSLVTCLKHALLVLVNLPLYLALCGDVHTFPALVLPLLVAAARPYLTYRPAHLRGKTVLAAATTCYRTCLLHGWLVATTPRVVTARRVPRMPYAAA